MKRRRMTNREEGKKSLRSSPVGWWQGAEGGTGFLHTITKPAAWTGGLQVLEELEKDVKPMRTCEEKRRE